jgi:hypothetical protein
MDVFFYWKNVNEDIESKRIGHFRSAQEKLAEFHAGAPDYLWVFKTPKGLKGQVQLLARLKWSDTPVVPMTRKPGESYVFYDPGHTESVRFIDGGTESVVNAISNWVGRNFPDAIRGNFQGGRGQHAMRGPMLQDLHKLARTLTSTPFLASVEA